MKGEGDVNQRVEGRVQFGRLSSASTPHPAASLNAFRRLALGDGRAAATLSRWERVSHARSAWPVIAANELKSAAHFWFLRSAFCLSECAGTSNDSRNASNPHPTALR
jgi:hypothetical protein